MHFIKFSISCLVIATVEARFGYRGRLDKPASSLVRRHDGDDDDKTLTTTLTHSATVTVTSTNWTTNSHPKTVLPCEIDSPKITRSSHKYTPTGAESPVSKVTDLMEWAVIQQAKAASHSLTRYFIEFEVNPTVSATSENEKGIDECSTGIVCLSAKTFAQCGNGYQGPSQPVAPGTICHDNHIEMADIPQGLSGSFKPIQKRVTARGEAVPPGETAAKTPEGNSATATGELGPYQTFVAFDSVERGPHMLVCESVNYEITNGYCNIYPVSSDAGACTKLDDYFIGKVSSAKPGGDAGSCSFYPEPNCAGASLPVAPEGFTDLGKLTGLASWDNKVSSFSCTGLKNKPAVSSSTSISSTQVQSATAPASKTKISATSSSLKTVSTTRTKTAHLHSSKRAHSSTRHASSSLVASSTTIIASTTFKSSILMDVPSSTVQVSTHSSPKTTLETQTWVSAPASIASLAQPASPTGVSGDISNACTGTMVCLSLTQFAACMPDGRPGIPQAVAAGTVCRDGAISFP